MKKTFMGVRLRRLREERGMTQADLARALELSPSYLNQIEQNQRPLTVAVLLKLNAAFGLDVQLFAEEGEARLVAELRAALGEEGSGIALAEARTGIANYFAGALLMPYGPFLAAAETESYDIDLLGRRFGVGFETVCHRLSTLQKPEARGVPFFFIRTDRAGNISKRQSASDFHFSRIGGTCPLWTIYEAFARPGQILTQIAEMPDGRRHLWIARTTTRGSGGYGAPAKTFALAMGCDLRHAARLVYARGLDLRDPAAATPIGAGCKVCERPACPQRAFPPAGRPLAADPGVSRFAPYSGG